MIVDAAELEQRIRRDGRYCPQAIGFLQHALERTTLAIHGPPIADGKPTDRSAARGSRGKHGPASATEVSNNPAATSPGGLSSSPRRPDPQGGGPAPGVRHISGQQLCHGIRREAQNLWGMLAPLVLSRWNIRSTRDIGELVFLLIDLGLMGRQESDRIEDFDDVFDFNAAFADYEISAETESA